MQYYDFDRKSQKEILELKTFDCGNEGMLPLLQFSLLNQCKGIQHAFTTREGGVSKGIFESLNLSFTRGDEPEAVLENYRRIACVFHKDVSDIVCSDQTHTTNVMRVDRSFGGCGITKEGHIPMWMVWSQTSRD